MPRVGARRAGRGHSILWAEEGKKALPIPPSPRFWPGQRWVPLTSCHQGRVSPADGVRRGGDHVSQQHRPSSDYELGAFLFRKLLLSLSAPSISPLFIHLLGSFFFPSTLTYPFPSPFLSSLATSPFFSLTWPLQCEVRGRTLQVASGTFLVSSLPC